MRDADVNRDGVDRRSFLRLLAAAGLAPTAGLLASCTGSDRGTSGASAGSTAQGVPVKGGVLRVAVGSDIRGFDVQRFYDTPSVTMADLVFSRLLALDPTDPTRVLPDLAESVPTAENGGLSWTFKLRSNARFHDGSPVTADDVKFSLERLIDARTKSEAASYYTGWIKGTEGLAAGKGGKASGITVIDPRTVRIELSSPRAAFLQLMAIRFASIYPRAYVEKVGADKFNRQPVGSGPFSVKSYETGKKVTFRRHDNYHAADQIYLDGVELSLAVQPDTAILQIDGGQLDVITDEVPPASYQKIKSDPQKAQQLVEDLVDDCWYLTLNAVDQSPIFKSVEVRKAIHQAIDKRRLLQQMQGRGQIATSFWSPRSAYHDTQFPSIAYDPAAARQALQTAGVAGQSVEVLVPAQGSFFPIDQWGPSVVQDLEAAGLKPKLSSMEVSAWLNKTMQPSAVVPNGWPMDIPHGSYIIDSAFTTQTKQAAEKDGVCCNFSQWASPEVDRLDQDGVSTSDKQKEIDDYRQIMRIAIGEQYLWVPCVWPKRAYYHGPKVGGVTVFPNTSAMLLSRLWLKH